MGPPKIFFGEDDGNEKREADSVQEVDPSMGSREEYRKTAQLIVAGNQDNSIELPYLIDSLYESTGRLRL